VAVLGNAGTREDAQRDVGHRIDRHAGAADIQDALLLGNNLYGSSEFNHLDFINGFEKPYERLLKRGVTFHALLGHEDQSHAPLQLYYPAFHMEGRRYYRLTLGYGMVDVFMLDSDRGDEGAGLGEDQLAWLDAGLAASRAPWKVVALHRALYSAAGNGRPDSTRAAQLAPMLKRHGVGVVVWSGGQWYERLELPDDPAVYVGAGWSGGRRAAGFNRDDRRLESGDDQHDGFVLLNFTPRRAQLKAIDSDGRVVDTHEFEPPENSD
jgi:hypothetical protein